MEELDKEEFLGVLLNSTQEQQEAIAKAIKVFERENHALSVSVPMLRKSLEASLAEAMTETASTAKTAIDEAIKPILGQLTRDIEQTTRRAADEKKLLNQVSRALSWKGLLFASVATLTASAAGALILSGYLAIWWNRAELERLTEQKAVMVENIDKLDKVKGGIKLDTCDGKPCIEVDTKHAFGDADSSRYKFFWLRNR